MPIFEYNGKKYNVRDEHIDSFMKDFPDASTIMEREGKKYRVKSADYRTFMSEQQQPEQSALDSTPETPVTPSAEEMPLTEQDKIRFSANIGQMKRRTEQMIDGFNERMETMREYHENAPLGGGQTAEGKMQFNPESGKLEKTYITPLGNRYTSKGLADMESFRYRQAADMSVNGQLRRAMLKLAELQEKREASAKRVHEQWEEDTKKNTAPLGFLLAADTYVPRQMSDKENSTLDVAIRQTEELIKDLEEQKDREQGIDVGFWRGFGRVAGDFRTWDFGMSDMRDALTMMNADDLKGENATEGEREAYNEMMGALYNKGQAEQMYGGNAGFWNRAGMMTGHMPAFMLDFGITGGGFKGINVLSKAGTKAATKVVGKETVEQMAKQGFKTYVKDNGVKGLGQYATNWTIKALGTTADDLLLRAPLMTNTVQAGKTTADIIDRKLGDVVVDENGNYDFSNDKTWGNAIWQGEANAIVENYSEMFGSHLDPVVTLGNMSKLANVVGAKRIGAVLSKTDAGALDGIMGQTHQLFNKMGVSDYFGEVTEEYYGQLWRTMLNLDDAYQQNPDGTRTNLLATGQFHGDIWGGMALSMGLMGAGKATLSGVQYASMKHGVNKADARATELLGKEIWEPLRATIDLTTNDDIGSVAEGIVNDKDFSDDERAAILTYMERSLMMRGFNLGTLAQKRGGEQDEDVQSMNESYIDGYNLADPQEMTDAKNMRDYQRQRVSAIVDENTLGFLDIHPMNALEEMRNNGLWGESELETVIDYLNAKQVYDGMIQRVRDDIDARVEQSNAMVDARTNRTSGMIQGATMKQDDRRVYVVGGNLVQYADGSGIDNRASDGSIIVRDAETGALEQVSPDAVLNIDEPLNPSDEKMTAEEAIIQQFAQEASDKIDGVVTFNPGDTYTITGDDAQIQVQIVANEDGIVDNGDGTVNVSDGVNIFPLAKETIQQQADAANLARVAQFEQQRTIENAERKQEMQEAERPQYALNDIVSLTDENGVTVRGNITADADADGKYEVFTEAPINGKRVNLFTRDELDNMLLEHNGVAFEHPAENESNNGAENIPENDNNAPQNIPAMQRIPKDEQGNPLYEQADSDTAWDAIVEQTEGDEDMAQTVADGMVADKEEALKKLEKAKSKGGNSIAEKIASEKERKAAIDAAKQDLLAWQKIAGTANRRRMAADAERKRMADEAAALRKAEEEKLRAEREEAERVEREALNGVPDMVDDTPQDARARGYRRVNGHKIDRQEPLQTVQGKEVNVKFSNDVLAPGHVAVIDASLLQPSHIQGVRNPLHFIDEAQPKERNDEASVLSARKIAGNIRPEEITSSITAYTGAPTVNERGEVIQGNNRSDALRLMWESHPEQAEAYRQYLKDHAEEFGLRAEDIAALQSPVLVNMLHVDDATAIPLGQYVAQDTESGGVERIKPKNALQRMGIEVRSFANLLLRASDDEVSFAGLVDANGASVLKWMSQRGFISPTQYKSAFDSKGNLTPESKNDLRGIMYQSIFKDGSTRLEEMFNVLPVKAQKAILATAFRDYDSPNSERMVDEIQNSVRAYYALSQDKMFVEAKNFKEARTAVESWKRQYQMDDVTGESYLPADNFSNFVLHLAAMYKGESQSFIQNTFGKIYDLIQGTQEETLFEQPDNTPRTLVQAIKEALNLDYNGQQRSNVLVGDTATSQRGQQGSNGTLAPRERVENGNGTTDDTGRTESIGGQSEIESSLSQEEMLSSDDTDNQLSAKIARRIEVQEDDWIESGKYGDTYKQTIIVDGTHKVIKVDAPDTKGNYIGSAYEYDGQTFGDLLDVLNYIDASLSLANAVAVAEKETDTTPTEKQKEAGNYKKGHVQVGTFNITIENPKGSVRSGIDTEGNKWETIMQNTYGYIRGTEGVDGDHIDVFLSDDIDGWNGRRVFVVDQYNEDGSFDEHKVMLGFNETDDAEAAYFANYDSDWANNHKTVVTAVNLEDFEKWIDSSHRKTKAFAEYKSVKSVEEQSSGTQVDRLSEIKSRIEELHKEQEAAHVQSDIFEEARIISEINDLFAEQRKLEQSNSNEETTTPTDAAYTITPAQYTTKRGKVLDMHLVEFNNELRDTVRKHTTMFAKQLKGWWDKEKQGFMMRSKEDAERLAEYATDAQSQPPLSLSDLSEVNDGNVQFSEPQQQKATKQEERQEYTPITSHDGKVEIMGNSWAKMFYLTVPKTKKDGAVYYENKTLLRAAGGNFYPYRGKLRADIPEERIIEVVKELAKLGVKVKDDTTDILQRNGIGAYNDDEVSYENDPVAKLLGQSRRTAKQRREFARRERQRMAERVESLAEKLHLDNVEVVTDASVLDGKKQRAKGFYSKSTGKITIVIPNHTSTFDVEQTLLHEAVAHYGLRQLFGEHFDTFLDNVFNNADENIRRRIVDMAAKNGWDFHKATEEYLASLAEDTEFENINASWWQQIKDFFLNMLHKIGFEDFRGVTLSDNELRYILWRSYENLAEPGRYRNILGEAADVAKQYELKVGNYAVSDPHHQTVAESDDALYRTGDPEIHERELARDRYERRVKSGMFQSQEALQDSMLGLKEAMTAILGKETNIEDVDGFENAYLGENRLSSVNKAEADAFAHTLFKPMLDEVAKLARTEAEREELTDYMMAKHGLERNTYMRNEAINNGATDADQTDYAGLTALTGMDNVADAETEAQIMVNDYEQAHDTTDLWKKVNAASKAILSKSYECGMMSKATFDKISDMYDFYIPLRGFDEKTSSEAYAYLTHKQSAFNAPIKKAEGRRSKADDPFANLQSMAEGAIMQGNRNKLVKQRFLNFALNHPSDLVSVSDIWVEYDTVADEWKPVFPDNIDSTDTPEVVERKMLDFETKMESLAQQYPDRYKHGKDTVNIPYRIVESRDMRQHQIVVKRGGRDYVITINGNPRAAQALNGQTNPDNDMSGAIGAILRAGENINRQLSAFYTTRNPDFIVSNFMRDMLYTNTMTWIRESPNYALRFHRNYMYANPVRIKQLLAKHRKGTLDMSNKTEAMFHQFMMNGGETGYANIRDIEQHKNDIRRELKKSNGKIPVKKAWDLLGGRFDEYNRAVENCARFAAFMTSREMGRSIDRAIYDAKEISVNFNKKGSGAKFYDSTGQTKAGNASALVSGLGRSGYVFWNAAIQGTANFGRQMKRHPAKAFTGIAAMFLLGAIVAYLGGDDDDDDDKNAYYNLPEYVRRSNILFRAGNSWVSIPLPVEYRAVYGMGELMISVLNGKEHLTDGEIAEAITGQATQILPIDFLEGGGGLNAFVPSAYKPLWEAYVAEKSWTGMPLYKDTPYNKDMPEWTKAYKSANKYIVGLANAMNEATGGDPYTKGTIDFNPAKIEYMLNGYFGGVFGTIDKLSKMVETVTGNREYDPRSFLLANRLVKAGDERTEYRAVNNEYFRLKEEHDRLKSRLKHYEEDTDNDIFDYAEKIDFLYNSPEYERYEIFEDYREDIDDLYNELKEAISDEERKDIEAELNELKKEMIEEMNKTRK